ncbi:MAG: DUF2027 domain-containing protein [Bacteroidota bacterium]
MSTLKLGDKVRFVNENMQGVVTNINGKIIGVTIEDDFEIPVASNEVVKIEEVVAKKDEPVFITKKSNFVKVHSGIHIAFERLSETALELKLHNSESDIISFAYFQKNNQTFELRQQGTIALETYISLGKFNLEQFNTWPEMAFQLMFVNESGNDFKPQLIKTMKMNAKEFHASFRQCYFLGKQAYTFRIDEAINKTDIQKLLNKDFSEPTSKASFVTEESLNKKPQPVVDLHIEKLTDRSAELSAQDILDLQMKVFSKSLEMAHVHQMQKIVFIHGIGNHFLKNKLKNYLTQQKSIVKKYQDADMVKFGGGATEVILI